MMSPGTSSFLLSSEYETNATWVTGERKWTTVQVVAEVLKKLARKPLDGGGKAITQATFGVPVRMGAEARRRLTEAAQLAGIAVTSVVKESTAACIRHRRSLANFQRVAIFDWGGGTLDVSILKLDGHSIRELYSDGKNLAGDDLDKELALSILAMIRSVDPGLAEFESLMPNERKRLLYEAERAKRVLGTALTYDVQLRLGGKARLAQVTREECDRVLRPSVRECVAFLETCIRRAKLSAEEVDRILLVGGSSHLRLLSTMLDELPELRDKFEIPGEPEWDVAHGAAAVEAVPGGGYELASPVYLELADGSEFCIVPARERPSKQSRSLSLVLVDNAPSAQLIFHQGANCTGTGRPILQFHVPAQGFDEEEVRLQYRLTEELTFEAIGQRHSREGGTKTRRD
ncbi:MAG: Hsp70 family protein [Bryobacterales bacterium]|nr:Hsp70 family protein [Bryobacterales bacterium]